MWKNHYVMISYKINDISQYAKENSSEVFYNVYHLLCLSSCLSGTEHNNHKAATLVHK